jgi:hypothetical protein
VEPGHIHRPDHRRERQQASGIAGGHGHHLHIGNAVGRFRPGALRRRSAGRMDAGCVHPAPGSSVGVEGHEGERMVAKLYGLPRGTQPLIMGSPSTVPARRSAGASSRIARRSPDGVLAVRSGR